jgi:hypothetical protein
MDIDVWYVHHSRMPRCTAPRIVRLDNIVDLWYADICTVWFDHIVRHEPLKVLIVKPRPAHALRSQATIHAILEQGMTPGRVALHFTANFQGGQRTGVYQVAESVPARICTNMMFMVVIVFINHLQIDKPIPVVPHKAVAEVSKIGNL